MKNKKGLTLIELLAVIAIIAILFVLLIPQVSSAIDKARVSGVQTDLRSYQVGVQTYLMENESAVHDEEKINAYLDSALKFENRKSKELNPWGNPYELVINGDDIKVISKNNKNVPNEYGLSYTNGSELEFIGFDKPVVSDTTNNNVPVIDPIFADTFCATRTITENPSNDFIVADVAGGVSITNYVGSSKDIVIPCQIDGKPVVMIGHGTNSTGSGDNSSFRNKAITSVVFPDTITEIGYLSFINNQITEVVIPHSVIHINDSAFHDNFITKVTLGNSIQQIGQSSFQNNKLTEFDIPSTVTEIRFAAFNQNFLTELKIPSSVTLIQDSAFVNNPDLKNVQNCSGIDILDRFNSDPVITTVGC